ncbi:hypothetical protein Rcae01_03074 [Novipirellula caenicola]|uniref:Uncharacterized protein n=1 Tax=Novipirellula caenicola TaxID=1536901 RepID=A0ABP9VR44_9BACT
MGVSPWKACTSCAESPEGTTGDPRPGILSPLRGFVTVIAPCIHGLTPRGYNKPSFQDSRTATKWRQVVAMGVSPWKAYTLYTASPEGTTGDSMTAIPVAPSGLCDRVCPRIHGLTPRGYNKPSFQDSRTATKWRQAALGTRTRCAPQVPKGDRRFHDRDSCRPFGALRS